VEVIAMVDNFLINLGGCPTEIQFLKPEWYPGCFLGGFFFKS